MRAASISASISVAHRLVNRARFSIKVFSPLVLLLSPLGSHSVRSSEMLRYGLDTRLSISIARAFFLRRMRKQTARRSLLLLTQAHSAKRRQPAHSLSRANKLSIAKRAPTVGEQMLIAGSIEIRLAIPRRRGAPPFASLPLLDLAKTPDPR